MSRILFVAVGHVLAVVLFFGALIAVLGIMRPDPDRQTPEAAVPTVFVSTATYEPVQLSVRAQGEVRPKQEIILTPQVGGKIVSVSPSFADGGTFTEGEVLVQIEDADYRLALTRARAQVATAEQTLAVERAEADLARKDYEELATASGDRAEPSALTLRGPQLARAEAEYQASLANLQDAQLALDRTKIRAPFDGRVRTISTNTGQFVNVGQQLGTVFSTDVAEVRLPLTDEDLARLDLPLAFNDRANGPEVILSANVAGGLREWSGRITRVDAAVDPTTRQISAIVEVEDPYGEGADNGFPMAIGLFVDAEILGPQLDRAVTLPRVAVRNDGSVFVLGPEDRLEARPVDIAAFTTAGVIITDGLEEGEEVVVSRVNATAGSQVRPLQSAGPRADEAAPAAAAAATATTAAAQQPVAGEVR